MRKTAKAIVVVLLFIFAIIACGETKASAESEETLDWEVGMKPIFQERIWEYLGNWTDNDICKAAIMGNIGSESNYCPWRYLGDNNTADNYKVSYDYLLYQLDSKDDFVYQWLMYTDQGNGAFGLFSMATVMHKSALWDWAEERHTTVWDYKLQIDYFMTNFTTKRPEVWEAMKVSDDLVDCTELFRCYGEGAEFTEGTVWSRTRRAVKAYNMFSGATYDKEIVYPTTAGGSIPKWQ